MEKIAVIDIGSNSVRYACVTDPYRPAAKQLHSTVLADGLFFSGRLKRDAIERTADAVCDFCAQAARDGAKQIHIFATEAVRAASNGNELCEKILSRTNIAVDVLTGTEEAHIGFLGALPDPHIPTAVIDVGGASCEIICGDGDKIAYMQSFPVGCVRLHDGAAGDEEKLHALLRVLPTALPPVQCLVGIGGTATALAATVHCPRAYDPAATHGSTVSTDDLSRLIREFFAGKDLRALYPCLTPNRARILGYGAAVYAHLLGVFGKDTFTVSERDNIEGYVLSRAKK